MGKPVNNATTLKPIVEKAVKALYGQAMQNVRYSKPNGSPCLKNQNKAGSFTLNSTMTNTTTPFRWMFKWPMAE